MSARNAVLHRRILEMSGHHVARDVCARLNSQVVRFQFRTVLAPGRAQKSLAEHRRSSRRSPPATAKPPSTPCATTSPTWRRRSSTSPRPSAPRLLVSAMSDPTLPAELAELRDRVSAFVRDVVIPAEARRSGLGSPSAELRAPAPAAGAPRRACSPRSREEHGGLGLDLRGQSVVFEEAGYSLLGPLALNCAAPDEGNMHLLERDRAPTSRRSATCAAGRRRGALLLRDDRAGARRRLGPADAADDRGAGRRRLADRRPQVVHHRRRRAPPSRSAWRAPASVSRGQGATMFLVDAGNPGLRGRARDRDARPRVRSAATARSSSRTAASSDDGVLGEVDLGFRYAQVRLAPARLTHCMRWLGVARRALDIALEHTRDRELFGQRLHDLGMAQQLIADSAIDIEASRALIRHAVLGARRRRPRRPRVVDRQGLRLRGGRPRRRPRDPDLRRARRLRRDAARRAS